MTDTELGLLRALIIAGEEAEGSMARCYDGSYNNDRVPSHVNSWLIEAGVDIDFERFGQPTFVEFWRCEQCSRPRGVPWETKLDETFRCGHRWDWTSDRECGGTCVVLPFLCEPCEGTGTEVSQDGPIRCPHCWGTGCGWTGWALKWFMDQDPAERERAIRRVRGDE